MLRATLQGLLAHKLRLALAALAVVLGVSFVCGTIVLGDTVTKTFDDLFKTTTAGIDVNVRGVSTGSAQGVEEHPPIPVTVADTIRGVPGVKEVFGYLQRGGTVIVDKQGKAVTTGGAPNLGLLWDPNADITALHLTAGAAPHGASEVVIDAKTASGHGIAVGDRIEVVLPVGAPQTFTVSGIAGFGTQDNLAGATIAAFDAVAGRTLLGAPNEFDGINVKAAAGVSADVVKARIAAVLPTGVEAVTGQQVAQEQSDAIKTVTGTLSTFLLVFALISLFVGSFIILNTFSILVAQRQRELALLRALGATRGQVMRSVLLEALITGLLASVVGVAFGVVIAKGLEALLGAIGLDLGATPLQIAGSTVAIGIGLGTVVTVVASLVPARKATRVAPVEALREATPQPSAVSAARIGLGAALLVAGIAVLLSGLLVLSSNQLLATGLGAALTFIGVAVLAPIIVPPVITTLGWPVRRFRGAPGRLATENARRNPRRTASTASALMIGVGLVACFTVVAASFKDSISSIVDQTVTADYIVSPQSAAGGFVPPGLAAAMRADSAIGTVSEISGGTFHFGAEADQVEAIDSATVDQVAVVAVQSGAPLAHLGDGEVAISEDAAKGHSLRVGDTVPMQFLRPGVRSQRVATVYARNPLLGDYLVTLTTWRAENVVQQDFVVLVKGASGVSLSDLRARVDAAAAPYPAVQVQNNAEYKKSQGNQIDVLLNLINVLVVLAIVIALLGVVNTVALSIVERTRELGLVRALGMTRSQMRSMVRWETVLITIFGTLLGLVVGLFFGVALVKAFASQGVTTVNLAPVQQLGYVLIAFAAGVVAAIFPARRAAHIDMLLAITSE